MFKTCIICNRELPLSKFSIDKTKTDGRGSYCKTCDNERKRIHANTNKVLTKERHSRYILRNQLSRKATSTISSHRMKGCIVNLKSNDVRRMFEDTKLCPICGCKLEHKTVSNSNMNQSSFDRINNDIVLDETNVWIICRRCNIAKGNVDIKTFITFCNTVSNNKELGRYL